MSQDANEAYLTEFVKRGQSAMDDRPVKVEKALTGADELPSDVRTTFVRAVRQAALESGGKSVPRSLMLDLERRLFLVRLPGGHLTVTPQGPSRKEVWASMKRHVNASRRVRVAVEGRMATTFTRANGEQKSKDELTWVEKQEYAKLRKQELAAATPVFHQARLPAAQREKLRDARLEKEAIKAEISGRGVERTPAPKLSAAQAPVPKALKTRRELAIEARKAREAEAMSAEEPWVPKSRSNPGANVDDFRPRAGQFVAGLNDMEDLAGLPARGHPPDASVDGDVELNPGPNAVLSPQELLHARIVVVVMLTCLLVTPILFFRSRGSRACEVAVKTSGFFWAGIVLIGKAPLAAAFCMPIGILWCFAPHWVVPIMACAGAIAHGEFAIAAFWASAYSIGWAILRELYHLYEKAEQWALTPSRADQAAAAREREQDELMFLETCARTTMEDQASRWFFGTGVSPMALNLACQPGRSYCVICRDEVERHLVAQCRHGFCAKCWKGACRNGRCPMCMRRVYFMFWHPSRVVEPGDTYVAGPLGMPCATLDEVRMTDIEDRAEASQNVPPFFFPDTDDEEPDPEPLVDLIAQAGDIHPNPGPPKAQRPPRGANAGGAAQVAVAQAAQMAAQNAALQAQIAQLQAAAQAPPPPPPHVRHLMPSNVLVSPPEVHGWVTHADDPEDLRDYMLHLPAPHAAWVGGGALPVLHYASLYRRLASYAAIALGFTVAAVMMCRWLTGVWHPYGAAAMVLYMTYMIGCAAIVLWRARDEAFEWGFGVVCWRAVVTYRPRFAAPHDLRTAAAHGIDIRQEVEWADVTIEKMIVPPAWKVRSREWQPRSRVVSNVAVEMSSLRYLMRPQSGSLRTAIDGAVHSACKPVYAVNLDLRDLPHNSGAGVRAYLTAVHCSQRWRMGTQLSFRVARQ